MKKIPRLNVLIGILAAGLVFAPLLSPIFSPWSEMNCWHQDINIKTGQTRYLRYLWFIKVTEQVSDTELSRVFKGEVVDVKNVPAWEHAVTFSPGVHHSPHYRFHSALYQICHLERIVSLKQMSVVQKRDVVRAMLIAWQKSGHDRGAQAVLDSLEKQQSVQQNQTDRRAK